jgi:SpoIID/LytB domain protein
MASLIFLILIQPAHATTSFKVSILSLLQPQHLSVTLKQPEKGILKMQGPGGASQITILAGQILDVRLNPNGLHLNIGHSPVQTVSLQCQEGCLMELNVADQLLRTYHGTLKLEPRSRTINIILSIEEEELAGSIAASEMDSGGGIEGLKAFLIVVRGFLHAGSRHPELNADFCDTTHCQVFRALLPNSNTKQALSETKDLVLTYRKKTFRPYYSRSCGGTTATFEDVWNKPAEDYPFYRVACAYCAANPSLSWRSVLPLKFFADITGIAQPIKIRQSGSKVLISSNNAAVALNAESIRTLAGRSYGWQLLPGNRFEIKQDKNWVVVEGRGSGHSIGFCQSGASGMATAGASAEQILKHYFPQTEIRSVSEFHPPR